MYQLKAILYTIKDFWERYSSLPILIVLIVVAVVLALIVLVNSGHLQTGFDGKTLWDWIEVLAVPIGAALIIGLLTFTAQKSSQRAETERELSIEHARESALREYLDHISDLVLEKKLKECDSESPERALAQAWTLGALKGLDGLRQGILVQFLHHSKLITRGEAIISLEHADLSHSNLGSAKLIKADLSHTNLKFADLYDTDLSGADLYRSVVGGERLAEAKNAIEARMPDGTTMTRELWEQFRDEPWEFLPVTDGA